MFLVLVFVWCFLMIRLRLYILNWTIAEDLLRVSLLEVHDSHLSLIYGVNFNHVVHMWLEFSTVFFSYCCFFFFLAINKQFVGRHLKIYPALHQNSCLNLASIADIILPWWLQNDSTNLVLPPHLPVGSQHSLRPLFAPIYLFIICINLWIPVFPLYFL